MNVLKLRNLLEGIDTKIDAGVHQEAAWSVEEKKAALEAIGHYNEYGKALHREVSLMELAHKLGEVASNAQKLLANELDSRQKNEADDAWFDKVMPERNMKELAKCSEEFKKVCYGSSRIRKPYERFV
jgi:hypothetical protein